MQTKNPYAKNMLVKLDGIHNRLLKEISLRR